MHGGGGAPVEVNDKQWINQLFLVKPEVGIYVVPRAPTNTWNLWHMPHIDQLFSQLISDMIILHDINPNKVYLMGYSAGGDGVAPKSNDSGKFQGYRATGHGRNGIKPSLYLAAMAARNSNSHLKIFYEQLIARGKKKKVALTALMRKIIVIANARIKELYSSNIEAVV